MVIKMKAFYFANGEILVLIIIRSKRQAIKTVMEKYELPRKNVKEKLYEIKSESILLAFNQR
jgi:hypothetical protein